MPRFQQQYYAIEGLERLNQQELGEVIKMAVYAAEKPITVKTSKRYLNYPLFYPAIKNKGQSGFLNTKKSFPKTRFGSTLSSQEILQIIENKSNIPDLIRLLHDTPIYGEVKIKKQSRGRPNKLLDAEINLKLDEGRDGLFMMYELSGKNSSKSDQLLASLPINTLRHNLSVIERNLTRIQDFVIKPDEYQQLWEQQRPVMTGIDEYATMEMMEFLSDWYWDARFDEMFWSTVLNRPVDFVDPGDIITGAINLGRHLGELSRPALQEMGKLVASGSTDLLEGAGKAIGDMMDGTKDLMKGFDSDDDDAAAILLIIGGVALTALLATGLIYGGIALRRELLDYNLIWLDRDGVFQPNKSRLPLRLLKDLQDD